MFILKLINLKTRVNTTQWIFPGKRKGATDKHSSCRFLLCLQVNAVVVCALQSVTGLYTLYLILQEQTEANSSSEDMDIQMANKGKYYKTHTVKTKVVLDFLFQVVKNYILS